MFRKMDYYKLFSAASKFHGVCVYYKTFTGTMSHSGLSQCVCVCGSEVAQCCVCVLLPVSEVLLNVHSSDVLDMPVDPNEPTYCLCAQVSYGEMIGCDNADVYTHTHTLYTLCTLHIHSLHTLHTLHTHSLFTLYTHVIPSSHTTHTLHMHYTHFQIFLHTPSHTFYTCFTQFTHYTLYTHWKSVYRARAPSSTFPWLASLKMLVRWAKSSSS